MAKTTKNKNSDSFAKQFEELEAIVGSLEDGKLDLDASLKQFEKGLKIAQDLKATLKTVENSIETLKKQYEVEDDADGA
ncbi:MAG: exodeoxyribonuclease VII small subunit [Candidatus Kerfeldbacteria bacterium]